MNPSHDSSDLTRLVDSHVRDAAGREAVITAVEPRDDGPRAWVQLADGMQVLVPVSLFRAQEGGVYQLPFRFDDEGMQVSIPVIEEQVEVGKRVVERGGVRVRKEVTQEERVIDEALFREALDVQRVPVGTIVAENDMPQARQEGDTYIVPVLEEVLVVQKQLLLKEEVRITRRREEVHAPQRIELRKEHVAIERIEDQAPPQ